MRQVFAHQSGTDAFVCQLGDPGDFFTASKGAFFAESVTAFMKRCTELTNLLFSQMAQSSGARTRRCRVETRLDTLVAYGYSVSEPSVGISAGAARPRASHTTG